MGFDSVVDVDGVLWDFSEPAYEQAVLHVPNFPFPEEWDRWDIFGHHGIRGGVLTSLFRTVHMRQVEYPAFPGARTLLEYLSSIGRVTIASHRDGDMLPYLKEWLGNQVLPYDDIHVSKDKTVLFKDADIIIDDEPDTLIKAQSMGKIAVGLRWPWNADTPGLVLFNSLAEVTSWLQQTVHVQ